MFSYWAETSALLNILPGYFGHDDSFWLPAFLECLLYFECIAEFGILQLLFFFLEKEFYNSCCG
jgi:hypothetical protein